MNQPLSASSTNPGPWRSRDLTKSGPPALPSSRPTIEDRAFDQLILGKGAEFSSLELTPEILTTWAMRLIDRMPEEPREDVVEAYQKVCDKLKNIELSPEADNSSLIKVTFHVARWIKAEQENIFNEQPIGESTQTSNIGFSRKTSLLETLGKKIAIPHTHPKSEEALSQEVLSLLRCPQVTGSLELKTAYVALEKSDSLAALRMVVGILRKRDDFLVDEENYPEVAKFEKLLQGRALPQELISQELSPGQVEGVKKFLSDWLAFPDEFDSEPHAPKNLILRALREGGPRSPFSAVMIELLASPEICRRHGDTILDVFTELRAGVSAGEASAWVRRESEGLLALYKHGQDSPELTELLLGRAEDRSRTEDSHLTAILEELYSSALLEANNPQVPSHRLQSAIRVADFFDTRIPTDPDEPGYVEKLVGKFNFTPPDGAEEAAASLAFGKGRLGNGLTALVARNREAILHGLLHSAHEQFRESSSAETPGKWRLPSAIKQILRVSLHGLEEPHKELFVDVVCRFPPITACREQPIVYPLLRSLALEMASTKLTTYLLQDNPDGVRSEIQQLSAERIVQSRSADRGRKEGEKASLTKMLDIVPDVGPKAMLNELARVSRWSRANPRHDVYFRNPDIETFLSRPLALFARAYGAETLLKAMEESLSEPQHILVKYHLLYELYSLGALSRSEYRWAVRPLAIPRSYRARHFLSELWNDVTGGS